MPSCNTKLRRTRKNTRREVVLNLFLITLLEEINFQILKKHMKVHKIIQSLSKGSPTKLKSYSIPHVDRTFDFSSVKTYDDSDLSPLGDDTDKFKRTLHKMTYAQLKKLSNNPQSWSKSRI